MADRSTAAVDVAASATTLNGAAADAVAAPEATVDGVEHSGAGAEPDADRKADGAERASAERGSRTDTPEAAVTALLPASEASLTIPLDSAPPVGPKAAGRVGEIGSDGPSAAAGEPPAGGAGVSATATTELLGAPVPVLEEPGSSEADAPAAGAPPAAKTARPAQPAPASPDSTTASAAPAPPAAAPSTPPAAPPAASAAASADAGEPAEQAVPAEPAKPVAAPELHSGHKLARRYRLEECLTRSDGFSSWRAVDEMLRRAVGVHIMASGHHRAKLVLAAARSAALLGDPRFVQVLDAVEDKDLIYVVHEWLPDATELTAVLASGPLPPYDADQMVRQLAEAMAAAHREGLAHLKLTPDAVLCTEDGQFRIRGLAVAAALHGCESDQPKRDDTKAIGALLYAALTQRWPYPQDAHGLAGLPSDLGLVPPDQVRAGVHRGLAELAMRALVNDGATPTRQEPPCATPQDLAKAAAAMPRVRPPEAEMPEYRSKAYSSRPSAARTQLLPPPSGPPEPPPALTGRAGRALKWAVCALLIVALGLGSWQVAEAVFNDKDGKKESGNSAARGTSGKKATQPQTVPLGITDGQEYTTDEPDNPEEAPRSYDGDSESYWHSKYYADGPEAQITQGVGIVYDLGVERELSSARISLLFGAERSGDYTTVNLYAADSMTASLDSMDKLRTEKVTGTTADLKLAKPVKTRYVLVWFTAMPYAPAFDYSQAGYKQGITDVTFTGVKG